MDVTQDAYSVHHYAVFHLLHAEIHALPHLGVIDKEGWNVTLHTYFTIE